MFLPWHDHPPRSRPLRVGSAALLTVLLTSFAAGGSQRPAPGNITIDYPPPSANDWLDVRPCPLTWSSEINCYMIGTRGPVKRISWRDDHLEVLDGYFEFDKLGNLQRSCRRGRVDLQGWSCGKPSLERLPDPATTRLDSKGRLLRRLWNGLQTCSYDDDSVPRTSECNDGGYVHKYVYDPMGRPVSYSRRRVPAPAETPEHTAYLARFAALDVRYVYTDDKYGNWTQLQMVETFDSAAGIKPANPILRRSIEYY